MGLENKAINYEGITNFTDLKEWEKPYVSYAFNRGFTKGTSDTTFGGGTTANSSMYLTFVLRALGYDDTTDESDFSYANAIPFAYDTGLIDSDFFDQTEFTRAQTAIISKNALDMKIKNEEKKLWENLVERHIFEATTYNYINERFVEEVQASGMVFIPSDKNFQDMAKWNDNKTELTIKVNIPKNGLPSHVPVSLIRHFFPTATKILYSYVNSDENRNFYNTNYNFDELRFFEALILENPKNTILKYYLDEMEDVHFSSGRTYIIDDDYNVIAWATGETRKDSTAEYVINTVININGPKLYTDYRAIVDQIYENWDKNTIEFGEERFRTWDNSDSKYIRPVKINGEYVSDGWYIIKYSFPKHNTAWDTKYNASRGVATAWYFSSYSKRIYESGEVEYGRGIFSDDLGSYPNIDEPGTPVSRGYLVEESSESNRIYYFMTKDGLYLGRIVIPADR
jgi:hypothetical protein